MIDQNKMPQNNPGRSLSEQKVERLLQDFFVAEIPAEFASTATELNSNSSPVRTSLISHEVIAATPDASRKLASYMAVGISSICCLLVTISALDFTVEPAVENSPAPGMASEDSSTAPETNEFIPVEERDHLPFSSLQNSPDGKIPGDGTSPEVENTAPLVPELEIELFPLRPENPRVD